MAAGVPIPVNIALPAGSTGDAVNPPITDSMVLPPPIPPARLFQAPDAYGAGSMMIYGYNGTVMIPPPVSNATDSGDPWINNQVAAARRSIRSPTCRPCRCQPWGPMP